MSHPLRPLLVTSLLLLTLNAPPATAQPDPSAPTARPPTPAAAPTPPTPPTISRETTYYLNPVDEAGYVDYVAALNQTFGHPDLPTDQNAFAGILQQLNTTDWPEPHLTLLHEALGLPRPAADHGYTLDFQDYARKQGVPADRDDPADPWNERLDTGSDEAMYDRALAGPWTEEQLPHVAAWLDTLEPPLTRIAKAVQREQYHAPLIECEPLTHTIMDVLLPHLRDHRRLGRTLAIRINRNLGADRLDEVVTDLRTMRRLAELTSREPVMISRLAGISIDSLATDVLKRLLASPALTAAQVQTLREIYRQPRQMLELRTLIEEVERLTPLDMLQALRRGDAELLPALKIMQSISDAAEPAITFDVIERPDPTKALDEAIRGPHFDTDRAMRRVNDTWNQYLSNLPREMAGLDRAEAELEATLTQRKGGGPEHLMALMMRPIVDPPREPEAVAEFTDAVTDLILGVLTPAVGAALRTELASETMDDLNRVALALAAFRLDHGQYPATLDELTPRYLDALPPDRYTGDPLRYRLLPVNGERAAGYSVYSVGRDLEDDGGTNVEFDNDADITFIVRQEAS